MEDYIKEKINERILLICESPNKISTLKSFLPKNYIVMASIGHIADIDFNGKYYNTGIDVNNNFEVNYVVDKNKKEIVSNLKEQVKLADKVYLATDPDREGEAIAWSLKEILKIPNNKYYRITFHEITEKAVLNAIANPRKIDDNLVHASHSRRKMDALLGFRMSDIARRNINAKSVGRCQSAGLEVLADREDSILSFIPENFGELVAHITKNNQEFKAKYFNNDKNVKPSYQECLKISHIINNSLKNGEYFKIKSIERKIIKSNPKAPFITSTFQQEVSSKLDIGVEQAMFYAQKLFEGINIGGQHIALITYIRTDDATLSQEFLNTLETFVKSNYGDEYYTPVRSVKNNENVQAGHEAIRPVDLSMTPSKLKEYVEDEKLVRVYEIIYRRTVACSMSQSLTSETTYILSQSNYLFSITSRELIFDGYKRIYNYKENDDNLIKVTFEEGESVLCTGLDVQEKQTKPPARYTEATFIKELERTGIGRPSTYATILKTLKDKTRGYCVIQDKCLVPTDKGMKLANFLKNKFSNLINIEYTSNMEKDLDLIARGELNEIKFLQDFLDTMEKAIKEANLNVTKVCPECGSRMVIRRNKKDGTYFWGCTNYPNCKKTLKID